MIKMIKRYGGWPVVVGRNWKETNWLEINAKMLNDGISVHPIFKLTPKKGKDQKHPNIYFLTVNYKRDVSLQFI